MKCHVCGGKMKAVATDLPFKISDSAIVIIKSLPTLQCDNCREFLIEDAVMVEVEKILDKADSKAELEVVRFAA